MYGALRLLYDNLITAASMLTLSSQVTGRISGVSTTGSGVATMSVTGPFAGAIDLSYEIVCDSVSGGTEIGEATIKWRTSNTATGTWEQTGVVTATSPAIALSADGLGTDITISFTGGVGADFAVGDTFKFECRATYGTERLIDRARATYWKSTGIADENIVVNYGAATNITAVALHDHNFSDSATVKFQANASDSWGSPSVDYTFTSITDPLVYYLDQTYQYNRWLIQDGSNTNNYLQVGNLMHTTYLQLEKIQADWGSADTPGIQKQDNESQAGRMQRYFYANRRNLELSFGEILSNNDVDSLITMQEALVSQTTHQILPLFVHLFYDTTGYIWLMDWENIGEWRRQFRSYLLNAGVSLIMSEVVDV